MSASIRNVNPMQREFGNLQNLFAWDLDNTACWQFAGFFGQPFSINLSHEWQTKQLQLCHNAHVSFSIAGQYERLNNGIETYGILFHSFQINMRIFRQEKEPEKVYNKINMEWNDSWISIFSYIILLCFHAILLNLFTKYLSIKSL